MENETDQNELNALTTTPSDSEKQVEVLSKEEIALISATINSIKVIFDKGATSTYTEIGTLIIEKIYDNKIDLIDLSKTPEQGKVHKQQIFKQLTRDITKQSKTGAVLPAKTFLYNSVKLVIDQKQLEECEEYKTLSISHKIELLPIGTKEEKIELVKEITQQNLSVRSTRELVYEKYQSTDQDIFYFIKNPDEISDLDTFIGEQLDQLVSDKSSIKSAKTACKKQLEHAEARIKSIEKEIARHQEHKTKLEALGKRLEEKAPAEADKKKKKKK